MTTHNNTPGRITFADEENRPARIKVVGVGGAGGNAIGRMITSGLQGVEFIAINTDLQALRANRAPVKIQIGGKLTKGLGAGANPEVGRQAAVEDTDRICDALEGSDMVFITAGLGGGTGTGAAPVVASIAGQLGGDNSNVLSVAVVTMPFNLEGKRRMQQALEGMAQLKECVDSIIVIPNERLLQSVARNTSVNESFRIADDVLLQAVQGISDIITIPGQINLDFADVRAVMKGMGPAVMGTGIGQGENRAVEAAQRAVANPLLETNTIEGARGVIINITGGPDLSLSEAADAAALITKSADPDANVIYGIVTDEGLGEVVKVTVIATGFTRYTKTPTDLANHIGPHAVAPPVLTESTFYRKTPAPKTAAPQAARLDLDVPTFLRRQGAQDGSTGA
ncbi:MAG: cell division protein FtsZ [Vicinamibacteria bacterium]|jgi:cell division protein FtsZ|nr:cell division protein FtsZ [Vicinamibacteria bacterium]